MELLVGCGNSREKRVKFPAIMAEWTEIVTLDIDERLEPNVVHDLRSVPYPFGDDLFDEVHAYDVLEHCGAQGDWRLFLDQFAEFWRIMKPGGFLCATVPAWDSVWAWGDPGHTRIISEASLTFLSQAKYVENVGAGPMTDYRPWYKADFELYAGQTTGDVFAFVLRAKK